MRSRRGQWPCEGIIYLDSKLWDQLRERERKRGWGTSKLWYGNNAELNVSANHSKAKGLWWLVVFFHNASMPQCFRMSSSLLFLSALIKSYDWMITIQGHTLSRISRSFFVAFENWGYCSTFLHYGCIIKSLLTQIHALLWHVCAIVCRQMVCPCVHTHQDVSQGV